MTQDGHVLSLAVSGLRGTGRTSLYKKLELVLPTDESFRGYDFAFLGNPFGHLPHPILWDGNHMEFGLSRLFQCWGMLNEFTEKKWIPAIKAGQIAVMDSCGLDAVLYATACVDCTCDDAEVLSWHKRFVAERLNKQGVSPPQYLITRGDIKQVVRFIRRQVPKLSGTDVRAFVEKELQIIRGYFNTGSGQHTPHYLTPTLSGDEQLREALDIIRRRILQESCAVAA
jgi:hypothetical protein